MSEFAQNREISNRLKKRFNLIRKPNLKEASESYRKLAIQLKEFPNYSGYCWYSAAKCEHQIVGSYREQLNQSQESSLGIGQSDSDTAIIPSINKSSNQALENLVQSALWTEFNTWMETARSFRRIDSFDSDIDAAISAYAHAIHTCPSSTMLSVVYSELASLYVQRHRFFEASEVYVDGGFYRDAINCLLRGHFYEEAYQCYQDFFKKQPDFENYSTLTDSKCFESREADQLQQFSTIKPIAAKKNSSLLLLFKNRTINENFSQSISTLTEEKNLAKNQESNKEKFKFHHHQQLMKSVCPFDSWHNRMTPDDYITFFLLRLYLYDPISYEYPSPIIPFKDRICEDQEEISLISTEKIPRDEDSSFHVLSSRNENYSDLYFANESRFSYSDLIDLNHLLETLYLSYRYDLRPSIDNEYSEFDVHGKSSDSESENDDKDSNKKTEKKSSEKNFRAANSTFLDPSICGQRFNTDCDSMTTTSTTSPVTEEIDVLRCQKSPSSSTTAELFEMIELIDVSERLKRLSSKYGVNKLGSTTSKSDKPKIHINDDHTVDQALIERKIKTFLAKQEKNSVFQNNDDDHFLREKLAEKLCPLLNGHQIELLYEILKNKD